MIRNPWDKYQYATHRTHDDIGEIQRDSKITATLWQRSFNNFKVNDGNREVFEFLRKQCFLTDKLEDMTEDEKIDISKSPEGIETPSFITIAGSTGVGKTHLAIAYAKWNILTIESKVLYFQVDTLLDWLKADNFKHYDEHMKKIDDAILLILDDFGSQKDTEWALPKLDQIIDSRYVDNKDLLVTTNLTPAQLKLRTPRIASRLASGYMFSIKDIDHRGAK